MKKSKQKPIPFDTKLSARLDRALIASESDDPLRRKFGKVWKRKIEKKIWGNA